MQFTAIVNDAQHDVTVVETGPNLYEVSVGDGAPQVFDARSVGGDTLSLLPKGGGEVFTATVEHRAEGLRVSQGDSSLQLELLDLRKLHLRQAQQKSGANAGVAQIVAPMPGKVVAVLVAEGQEVAQNQGLVVIEAMKMENELRAPKAGVVCHLQAAVGAAVESGVILCVIE